MRELGAEVISISDEPTGLNINQECGSTDLNVLKKAVLDHEADFGVALDGDGDRVGLIDNKGNIIYPDKYMMLLVEDILSKHKKGSIVYDVKCSTSLEKIISDLNGTPVMSRTGHSYIKSKIKETLQIY